MPVSWRQHGKIDRRRVLQHRSQFYGNTILSKLLDVDPAYHDVVLITLFHKLSTQEDPHHIHCDTERCFYQQAITEGV